MGLFDKVKGFLNIGGPQVSITEVTQPITGMSGTVTGAGKITTKRPAKIGKCKQRFFVVATSGSGEDKSEETTTLGETEFPVDFEVREGIHYTFEIRIDYDTTGMMDKLASKGGMLGALGKVGKFAASVSDNSDKEYFVEVTCDVIGTPLDPSAKMKVRADLED